MLWPASPAPTMATLREPDGDLATGAASTVSPVISGYDLCAACHVNPRHAHGRLSRCLPCIRADAQRFRDTRAAAEAALAARTEQPTKVCRTCSKPKSLGEFARHARGKDGRRTHCRSCVNAGKVKRNPPLSAEQRARDRERRRHPDYLARNLEAAHAWQARNATAVDARKAVTRAVKSGTITPAKTCQVAGCRKRSGLHGHHNSYAPRNHLRVVWLCRGHHQSVHAGMRFKLKAAARCRTAYAPETA
jgi:hypothetical protein